jgi:hypothetical protein
VVPGRALQGRRDLGIGERVVGRDEEVAEELARAEHRRADLHDPQAGDVGQAADAAQAEHLAPVGRAAVRHAPAPERDVRGKPVDGGEPDERPSDGSLADERDRRRVTCGERSERRARRPVEARPPVLRAGRHAEPHGPHGPRRRGQALHVLRERPVLGDRRPGEDQREHGGRRGDAERRDERAAVPPAEPFRREPDDVAGPAHRASPPARRLR